MQIRIGTSGWMYKHWKNRFYPQNLTLKDWLSFYSKNYSTVEINNSFYHLPKKSTFQKWEKETPKDFVFSVKANRYITHMKKLNEPSDALDNLFEALKSLGKKFSWICLQSCELVISFAVSFFPYHS